MWHGEIEGFENLEISGLRMEPATAREIFYEIKKVIEIIHFPGSSPGFVRSNVESGAGPLH